ncbi:RNA polymerase sigma-70 factor [Parasphingorhabdus litoris]|uniref:RNA polymerase sigma-70 factor n=1 Tax=Parasphingorhabdus litoris TaxID=394733 RepID=A0ABP3JVB4_9SPHN|nr:sigma-70 family RNA polymerase sigma factor [Parasphingorhabdus litoris]
MARPPLKPLRSDDRVLLELWAREFGPALKSYFAKRVSSPGEADDLVQDVFVRLARRADLASIETVEGYLFQTARTSIAEYYRKRASSRADLQDMFDEDEHIVAGISIETVLADKEAVANLISALYELPEKTRDIFVLYHFEGHKQMQIAQDLNIGIRTVERHLAQANAFLLKRVGRER